MSVAIGSTRPARPAGSRPGDEGRQYSGFGAGTVRRRGLGGRAETQAARGTADRVGQGDTAANPKESPLTAFELHIPETAGWRALITRAEVSSRICLDDALENYLIYLLLRHVGAPTTAYDGLAGGFLANLTAAGEADASEDLAEVGDQCLVFAGLFPEQAAAQLIPISYFVKVGQDAYAKHAEISGEPLFRRLSDDFVRLMDVLQCLRDLDKNVYCLDALSAFEQWQNTGSAHAFHVLKALTPGMPSALSVSETLN